MHRFSITVIAGLLGLTGVSATHAQTVTYYYTDPQGTPLAEADAQGNITAKYDYRPYGSQALGTPPDGPGYTGHVHDVETDLVYMQARYYDPVMGRFVSVDPVKSKAGDGFNFNRYAYANDNPMTYLDPNGMAPIASPLLTMKVMGRVVRNGFVDLMVAAGLSVRHSYDQTSITASVTGADGVAVVGTKNILHDKNSFSLSPLAGEGVEASIDAKYKLFTLDWRENPVEAPIKFVAHASAHDFFGGTVEVEWNPGGTMSLSIGGGPGMGEAFYFGAVQFDVANDAQEQEAKQKQEEWMKEQEVRRIMGMEHENRDYMSDQ